MIGSGVGISGISTVQYNWTKGTAGTSGKTGAASYRTNLTAFTSQTVETARVDLGKQSALFHFNQLPSDLKDSLVYEGRPISQFSPQEAADLISDEGYFGVAKTSARIADFVINLAGDDPEKLRVGRDAVLRGFKQAEKQWGGKLPEISYETLDKTLAAIDDKLQESGESVVDLTA